MKTDDLIRALAADSAPRPSVERRLAATLLAGIAVAAIVFAVVLGPRPDIAQVAGDFGFLFKFVVTLTLAFTACWLLLRLARPGVEAGVASVALLAAPAMLAAVVTMEWMSVDPALRMARLVGTSWPTCLLFIPMLSLPILAAALLALRHGAPTRPALAGAVAGLVAGGFGAAIYAAYCLENSALFLATWYTLAIVGVAVAGAGIGARLLRW